MYDNVITLITETNTVDEYGDTVTTEAYRQIFAEVKSIGQNEFYQAQAVGLKPEIKFVIADFLDYKGEKQLKYTPFGETEQIYDVIRTYRDKINLEIVCKRGID
jgi:SPP1 family predicted phage head-tail adaptor